MMTYEATVKFFIACAGFYSVGRNGGKPVFTQCSLAHLAVLVLKQLMNVATEHPQYPMSATSFC